MYIYIFYNDLYLDQARKIVLNFPATKELIAFLSKDGWELYSTSLDKLKEDSLNS